MQQIARLRKFQQEHQPILRLCPINIYKEMSTKPTIKLSSLLLITFVSQFRLTHKNDKRMKRKESLLSGFRDASKRSVAAFKSWNWVDIKRNPIIGISGQVEWELRRAIIEDLLSCQWSNKVLYHCRGRRPFIHALMKTRQDFYDAEIVICLHYRWRVELIDSVWSAELTKLLSL